jgi:hypothetical protein
MYQFEDQLEKHRQQLDQKMERAMEEEIALAHDRELHPRQTHNRRGELVFDMTDAKELLRDDVANDMHNLMTSSDLRLTSEQYKQFEPKYFKERVAQAVRLQKYIFYRDFKRVQERKKRGHTNV